MINFLSKWIEGIVIAVIIASMFEMLLPNGGLKKYIKIVLGIYVIFSIISPFVNSNELYSFDIENEFDKFNLNTSVSASSNNYETMEKMYKNAFEKKIIKKTEDLGYIVNSCDVDAVFESDKEDVGIKRIDIVLKGKKENHNSKNNDENLNIDEKKKSERIKEIEEVNKIEIGNTTVEDKTIQTIKEKEIIELKKALSDHFEIDKDIIYIQD